MRNICLILALCSQFFVFSQNKEKKEGLHFSIFNTNNTSIAASKNLEYEVFEKLLKSIYIVPANNSEGKFPIYKSFQKEFNAAYLSSTEENYKIIDLTENNVDITKTQSIIIQNYSSFIYEIINKISEKKYRTIHLSVEDIENNKIKNVFQNFAKKIEHDKLNTKLITIEDIDIEIGQNIFKYVNKIYKSEIDNTLKNSLNLLVANW